MDFSKFVDKEKSYHINNVDSWDKIAFLFDENIQSIIDEFAELGIPLPNYLSTTVKHDLLDGEIVMSWADKNVIVNWWRIGEDCEHRCCDSWNWIFGQGKDCIKNQDKTVKDMICLE